MTLSQSLVEVKTISSDVPRSEFDEGQIELVAQLIIDAEGIINPLIITPTGINSFSVVEGHFEYYAAVRAKQIDLEIGETIAAYIIECEHEGIFEQVKLLRKSNHLEEELNETNSDRSYNAIDNLETRLNNFELRIENRFHELKQEYDRKNQDLQEKIEVLNNNLPEKIEPLTTFNNAELSELISKLKLAIKSDNKATDIAEKIVKGRPFKSIAEVLAKTKGLGDKTMITIIDSWLYL